MNIALLMLIILSFKSKQFIRLFILSTFTSGYSKTVDFLCNSSLRYFWKLSSQVDILPFNRNYISVMKKKNVFTIVLTSDEIYCVKLLISFC